MKSKSKKSDLQKSAAAVLKIVKKQHKAMITHIAKKNKK